MENPDCHFGDHDYLNNGWCKWCGNFNGGLLQWQAIEKAIRENRHHGNHYHNTIEKAEACMHKEHDIGNCENQGGCFLHEPTDEWLEMQNGGLYV